MKSNFSNITKPPIQIPSSLYREQNGVERGLMVSTRTTCPLNVPQQSSNITLGVRMRTSCSSQDKHLTHHVPYTWLMTVPHSEGSPHTHRKLLPWPLPSLLHVWVNAAWWKQEGKKKVWEKKTNTASCSLFLHKASGSGLCLHCQRRGFSSQRWTLGPNRIKSGNSTQWFPNALCILKVPESYLGFHYFMGILALDGMQTEINSSLILQENQYRDCYCLECRDAQACSPFIRPPLLYRWMQTQHTDLSLIPNVSSFLKCLLRLGHDKVFHPKISQV